MPSCVYFLKIHLNTRSFLGNTRSKVFNDLALKRYTAGEVTSKVDIQVNGARKNLESLKARGLMKEWCLVEGAGRPKEALFADAISVGPVTKNQI